MALTPKEYLEEGLVQLHQLARSPGWAIYQTHLRELGKHNEARKAQALRANETATALLLQGAVDGLLQAADGVEKYMEKLEAGDQHLPAAFRGGSVEEVEA